MNTSIEQMIPTEQVAPVTEPVQDKTKKVTKAKSKSKEPAKTKDKTFKFKTRTNEYTIPVKYKKLDSVSAIIRAMAADHKGPGKPEGAINKMTGIRYQHARNVLSVPLKRK